MSSISPIITTNIYSGLVQSFNVTSGRNAPDSAAFPSFDSSGVDIATVDLKNYYSNIRPEDLYADMGSNVVKSAQELDNALASAHRNGYSAEDLCKIKKAEAAYKANCFAYKSTFQLSV